MIPCCSYCGNRLVSRRVHYLRTVIAKIGPFCSLSCVAALKQAAQPETEEEIRRREFFQHLVATGRIQPDGIDDAD